LIFNSRSQSLFFYLSPVCKKAGVYGWAWLWQIGFPGKAAFFRRRFGFAAGFARLLLKKGA